MNVATVCIAWALVFGIIAGPWIFDQVLALYLDRRARERERMPRTPPRGEP